MKIGLYGDSFTGETVNPNKGISHHWSTLLANSMNAELANFGRAGASVYYSYKTFLNNYNTFGLNIFLVTAPGRYTKQITTDTGGKVFLPNISSLDNLHNATCLSESDRDMLRGWFISSDEEYDRDMIELMVKHVMELDPNVIIIPCFSDLLNPDFLQKIDARIDLCKYQQHQAGMYGFNLPSLASNYVENLDIVAGHFTPEFNEHLFNEIKTRINIGRWPNNPIKFTKFKHSFNESFRKRQEKT